MGLDISSVGNHEFDEGSAELLRMQDGGCHPVDGCQDGDGFAGADFDYLAANVVDDDTGTTLFPPYEIRRFGGVKVGFIGVDAQGHADDRHAVGRRRASVRRRGRHDQRATCPKLKEQGVDAIVVLIHEGGYRRPGQVNDCARTSRPARRHRRALEPRSTWSSPATPTRPTTA